MSRNLSFEQAWDQFEASSKLFPDNRLISSQKVWTYLLQSECKQLASFIENDIKIPSYNRLIAYCYCMEENELQANKYLALTPETDLWKELLIARLNRDIESMFDILMDNDRAYNVFFLVHPAFDILRDDPRYEEYLRQSPFGQVSDEDVEAVMELVE